MVRILHAADFHLDSAYAALPTERSRQRRQESRELVERVVDYANDHSVQLLLLGGDLFDSDETYAQTGEQLCAALGRFSGQVVIAPGNHDCYHAGSAYVRLSWPENVHIFASDRLSRFDFPQYGCRVYGAAFTSHASETMALPQIPSEEDWLHIGLLHGDVGAPESSYRPLTAAQIAQSGLDYLALGHVHTYSGVLHAGRTAYAYPGCLEGRGFDERGEKGFLLGEVSHGSVEMHFVPFARHHYELLEVDVSDLLPLSAIEARLPEDTADDIYRIVLTGETDEPVRREALQQELAGRFYQLELRDQTRLRQDLWEKCGEDSLRGLFLQRMRERYDSADETERSIVEQAVRFGLAAMDNREV